MNDTVHHFVTAAVVMKKMWKPVDAGASTMAVQVVVTSNCRD